MGTIVIDGPEQRNALSDEVLGDLVARAAEMDADVIRCIVIAGGDKASASGADIRALLAHTPIEVYDGGRARLWERLRRLSTPVVAAVSGLCLGGGCELAMMADVVVASASSRFGLPETQLGGVSPARAARRCCPVRSARRRRWT